MEPEAKYTLVGGSVLVLLAMLVGAVAWLASASRGTDVNRYKIYFTRQSLEGLQVRSDVRMRGIRVGAVTGFSFAEDRPGTVVVAIGIDPATPVKGSTRAVVDRNLITGLATIRLQNLTEDSLPIARPAPGQGDPVIAEGASQLQQFSETASELARRADETMRRINVTLSNENQAVLAETLVSLRDLSRKAEGAVTRADAALLSVARTADAVGVATAGLSRDVHRLADRFDTLGTEAGTTLHDASAAMRQISGDVNQLSRHAESLIVDSNAEVRLTSQQLRGTADAVSAAARKFRDPRATLFGPGEASLGPGESR
jgi:phospholipid/cholesterol/gamma-HCH transport system substrate-binding protein